MVVYIKTDDTAKDTAEDVEKRFHKQIETNYELNKLLPQGKNKKVMELTKDKIGGKIMQEFLGFKAKTRSYLIDDSNEDTKAKGTKKCGTKRKLRFENYKNCLEATQHEKKNLQKKKMKITYIVLNTIIKNS